MKEFVSYIEYWHKQGADEVWATGLGTGTLKTETHALDEIISYRPCKRWGAIVITAKGDVLPACCDYSVESVGNVYKESFYDIITSGIYSKYTKAHKELDIDNLPSLCKNCPCIHVYNSPPVQNRPLYQQIKNMLKDRMNNKKLIVFGTGAEFEIAKNQYIGNKEITYFVDNDSRKWNTFMYGIEIRSPSSLKDEDNEKIFVLIASAHFLSIQSQLESYGINKYYSTPLFFDRYIESTHRISIPLK